MAELAWCPSLLPFSWKHLENFLITALGDLGRDSGSRCLFSVCPAFCSPPQQGPEVDFFSPKVCVGGWEEVTLCSRYVGGEQ